MVTKPKGSPKSGGRKAGTPNKVTAAIKELLHSTLPDPQLREEWRKWLKHKDPHIRFEAFKLANQYMFGKPVTIVAGAEELPPVHIDISAIPRGHEKA